MTARSNRCAATLAPSVVPLTIPIGEQASFSGVVDLVARQGVQLRRRQGDRRRDARRRWPTPSQRYREQLVETAVESDDDLMTKYLEGEEISEDELRRAIKAGRRGGARSSGAGRLGGEEHRRAARCSTRSTEYLPSAAERATADATAAPVAFVFKTIVDPQKGTYTYLPRLSAAHVKSDSHLYNCNTGDRRAAGRRFSALRGKLQEPATEVPAGDIARGRAAEQDTHRRHARRERYRAAAADPLPRAGLYRRRASEDAERPR